MHNNYSAYSMYINYVNMYKYIMIIMKLASFVEQHLISILINGCGLLQMASYNSKTILRWNLTINKFIFVLELLL